MFDIGFAELLIVAIIGLVVIGPERLPSTLRTISLWLGRLKRSFQDAKAEIEREIGADEVKAQLHNEAILKSLAQSNQTINNGIDDIKNSLSDDSSPENQVEKPSSK